MAEELLDVTTEAGPPLDAPPEPTLDILRHSAAHLLAAAVVQLIPGTQYDVGPAIEDGFFYNFLLPDGRTLTPEDLQRIEARMQELVAQRLPFERLVLPRHEARELFLRLGQRFKVDIIDRLGDEVDVVSIYRTGDFVDLCRGPHVPDTGWLRHVRLLRVAGVYWRGDERNPQLQRVYGTAWFTADDLEAYLHRLEEAERRDHRRLGRELDLFSLSEELGGGLVLWHPRGGTVRSVIEDHWRALHRDGGYQLVFTPHIALRSLWERSGHTEYYAENMYAPIVVDDRPFQLKPMNCPFHILIYRSRTRSYRDLPIRLAELGTVYRYERSGVLHGLLRVRGFTQDDAHIFCRPDQIDDEVGRVIDFSLSMLSDFGFDDVVISLGTRPEKAQGSPEQWERATTALEEQLRERALSFVVDRGGGAFYGPKIDVRVLDALGREWQCATVQFDFTNPENFDLEYVGADGTRQRPVMVHRALLGSIERFFGLLLEHYAGELPLWLAPEQCEIVPVQDDDPAVLARCHEVAERLRRAGLRPHVDDRPGERMQARIRDAVLRRVPYVVVIGRRDVERGDDRLTIRDQRRGGVQETIGVDALVERLKEEVAAKRS